MKITESGIDLIKDAEGLRTTPYICPAGKLTVGYGHTGNVTGPITPLEADELLKKDLINIENQLKQRLSIELTDNQYSALVSFIYNVGIANFDRSTLKKYVNAGEHKKAADEFLKWVYAAGKPLEGLRHRREAERNLYLS